MKVPAALVDATVERTAFDWQVRLSLATREPGAGHRFDVELVLETPFLLFDDGSGLFWLGLVAKLTGTADDRLHDEITSDHERHCSHWALCPQQIYLQKQSPNAASPQTRPGRPSTTGSRPQPCGPKGGPSTTRSSPTSRRSTPRTSASSASSTSMSRAISPSRRLPTVARWNHRRDDPADRMNPTRCLRRGGPLKAAPSRRAGESGSCATLSAALSTQEGTG